MSAKHTPGPWEAWKTSDLMSADQFAIRAGDKRRGIVAECGHEANARLIAAAPELLAVAYLARELLGWIPDEGAFKEGTEAGDCASKLDELLRVAIAKAKPNG